jgi:hypothetical protein
LRWLGVSASWRLAALADRRESRTRRAPGTLDAAIGWLRR